MQHPPLAQRVALYGGEGEERVGVHAIHAAASRGVGGRLDGCIQSRALASLYHKFTNACPPNVVPIRSWLSVFADRAPLSHFRGCASRAAGGVEAGPGTAPKSFVGNRLVSPSGMLKYTDGGVNVHVVCLSFHSLLMRVPQHVRGRYSTRMTWVPNTHTLTCWHRSRRRRLRRRRRRGGGRRR